MDNKNIKFKKTGSEDWFEKIDLLTGKKISFPKKHGYYTEMLAWVAAENEIEPQFTTEELSEKEANDFGTALESQKATCIQLLNDSEKAVSNDPPYPDDIEAWKTFRASLRAILKSDQLETVPKKPF